MITKSKHISYPTLLEPHIATKRVQKYNFLFCFLNQLWTNLGHPEIVSATWKQGHGFHTGILIHTIFEFKTAYALTIKPQYWIFKCQVSLCASSASKQTAFKCNKEKKKNRKKKKATCCNCTFISVRAHF